MFAISAPSEFRIILQSMFVNQQMVKRNSNGRIVIKSFDNDVLLLSLHFYSKMTSIDELWFQTGSITSVKDGRQFKPVHDLYNSLGAEMANILPIAHSLTVCDTGFLLSAKNLFTITDIVFGKLHHRLLTLKITSQENFTFSDRYHLKSLRNYFPDRNNYH
jgi:hypothetical protein